MNQSISPLQNSLHQPAKASEETLVISAQQVPNALLSRLIQEVQHEAQSTLTAYNRTHNRHNRGR
jgi:hypothetical protein